MDSAGTDILLNNLPGLAYRCEPFPPWKMHYVSRGVRELCGYEPDDLFSGRVSWAQITHPSDLSMVDAAIGDAVVQLRPFDLIYRIVDRTGETKWVHERGEAVRPAPQENPVLVGFVMGVTVDYIAESRKATTIVADEEELRRGIDAEMIYRSGNSAMASLAATVGHELNQPLTAAVNYSSVLKRVLANDERVCRLAEAVQENSIRAADILRRLRSFVMSELPHTEPVRCSELVLDALKFATHGCEQAAFQLDLQGHALVLADRVQIQQVLVNLIRNACEAVARLEDRRVWITTSVHGSPQMLLVTVCNNGPPVPVGMLEKIFEAGASNKPGGMGIGLSISRTIVHAHGGRIWASQTESGLRLSFELPVWQGTQD